MRAEGAQSDSTTGESNHLRACGVMEDNARPITQAASRNFNDTILFAVALTNENVS